MSESGKIWDVLTAEYEVHICAERNLSANSVESYMRDLRQFGRFMDCEYALSPLQVTPSHIDAFLAYCYDCGMARSSQARILSSLRGFYHFLVATDRLEEVPTEFIPSPRMERRLPDVLTTDEINRIIASFDNGSQQGVRNRAIIEVLYSCGLRVSEAASLTLSDLRFDEGLIRIVGKGDRERLVPISGVAEKAVRDYLTVRSEADPRSGNSLFLSNRRRPLSRVMLFNIIKEGVASAGINKSVSPHTLRHSFATHLLAGGADIRHVQELLGHESVSTTEIYTHLDREHLRRTLSEHHPLSGK